MPQSVDTVSEARLDGRDRTIEQLGDLREAKRTGGVQTASTGGVTALVVSVDAAAKTAVVCL